MTVMNELIRPYLIVSQCEILFHVCLRDPFFTFPRAPLRYRKQKNCSAEFDSVSRIYFYRRETPLRGYKNAAETRDDTRRGESKNNDLKDQKTNATRHYADIKRTAQPQKSTLRN